MKDNKIANSSEQVVEKVHKNKLIPPNPEGKGGFKDNPGNRNPGGWKKEDSISYQYKKLIRLSVDDFKKWEKINPESSRTVAQGLAYAAVINARKDLKYLIEVTDRTEGKALQQIKHDGELDVNHIITKTNLILEEILNDEDTDDTENH